MIDLRNVHKKFGEVQVIKGIDIRVNKGEIVSIIGPSGAGKSTLLRCINCLDKADMGKLRVGKESFNLECLSKKEKLWIRRNTAMVFQNFYLFNNKTALKNITEGLRIVKKVSKQQAEERALDILDKVGLKDKKDSYPSQLSGGQQQRIAIGRALALEPKIILLDEPTSALDPELISEVLNIIKNLASENTTMLIVTHEIAFARNISDRIYFIDEGSVIEEGPAIDIIDSPKNNRTKQFLSIVKKEENY